MSSASSGRSTSSQNVQFQPAAASAGVAIWVRWPPKKASPRAPATTAWYAMNRSSARVGNRGTIAGCCRLGLTPLHAIWSVIHTGFAPAALTIFRVMSPTTLMSWFAVSVWVPGG